MSSSFSRNNETTPLGKCTAPVPCFKVPEETFEAMNREARDAGMSLSEWMRTLCMVRVHGIDVVTNLHRQRLEVVSGMAQERKG